MSSQPFFVKVHHLWKSKINCIYRGRFAEPANFCNVFWTTSHPRGSCNTQCQVVMWETGGEDFMMQRSLIVCKVCLPLSSVITLWRSAIFSSKLPPHFTSDIIWPFFPPRNDSVLIICKHRPWLSVRWNPTSSGGGKGWRACSSSSANNKCNQMRQRASTCQQQTRSLLVQSALDANIPHFHSANWYCHALEYLVLMSQFWFVSTIGWLFCAVSTITPPIYRVFLFNWYPP